MLVFYHYSTLITLFSSDFIFPLGILDLYDEKHSFKINGNFDAVIKLKLIKVLKI